MPQDIQELERRLKAILAKADALLFHPDSDEESPLPDPAPLEAPAPGGETTAPPPVIPDIQPDPTLHLAGPPIFKLLPSAPEPDPSSMPLEQTAASTPNIIPMPGTPPLLFLTSVSAVVTPKPDPAPTPEPAPARVPAANEIPFLIGYPESQEMAARDLHERLERLEPKFTKFKFHLTGYGTVPYSRDHPLREAGFEALQKLGRGVLMLITTKKLNPKSIDALTAELARHGLYFQIVPVDAITHKAFYFDFLLGLAFFLKAQKGD